MFRPEKMSFVSISVLDEYLTQVLDRLAKLGVMHIVDKAELPPVTEPLEDIDIEPVRDRLNALNSRAEEMLTILTIGTGFPSILAGVSESKIEIDPLQISEKIDKELSEIEAAVTPVIQRRVRIQTEVSDLEESSHQIAALEVQDVKVEDLKDARFLYFAYGDIPEEYYERLVASVETLPCVLAPAETIAGRQQILAFSLMDDREPLSSALEAAYFSEIKLPERYHGTVPEVLDEIELELWAKREEMAELQGEIRSLRQNWRDRLLELRATIAANQIVVESMEKFGRIDRSYFVSGWVPYKDVERLQELEDISDQGILVNASEPVTAQEAEHYGTKVPTKLSHPFFLRPFAGLVTNIGVPRYSDIDPTPFASLAFLAMFGIMFADVGHGAVLLLLGLFGALYPLPQFKSIRQLSAFLASCGGASIIFGFVFGSVFGKEEIIKPIWFSLEHMSPGSVNRMLKLGIFFGVGILSLGVSLNVVQAFRRKDFKEAFCGQWGLFSLIFYWTAVFLLVTGRSLSWQVILIIVLLLMPIMLKGPLWRLLGRKREHDEEEEAESMIEAGFEIYEISMAYLANTLSYIRMAAFNLSHAGLMMASYSLTKELSGGSSNFLLTFPSNLMANAFVIVLEGLIVAIQCMRLEYYEFFSKFFAGEGIEYKPMKIQ